MVSAYSRDELLAQPDMNRLVDQVLTKPITASSLYTAVTETLNQRRPGLIPPTPDPFKSIHRRRIEGARVLVVDDSEINLEVSKGILEADGGIVHLAKDGQDALDWLQAHPDAVDIVLMDVQMPRLDGYAATRRIREDSRWKELPIVALTAGAYKEQRDIAEESGMNDFVAKPFNVLQLIGVIQRWTGRHTERVENEAEKAGITCLPSTTQPVSQSEQELPNLPGIALSEALEQWDKPEVYRKYLDKFVATHSKSGIKITTAIQQGDLQSATAQAHKLCGLAGNLRLPQVSNLARELEAKLKAGEVALGLATELQFAIDQVCHSIENWQLQNNTASSYEVVANYDQEQLLALFKNLLEGLDHNDPDDSISSLNQLQKYLPSYQYTELMAHLSDFDFQAAMATVRSYLQNMNLSMKE